MRWWEHLIPNRPMLHSIDEKITTLGVNMALNADELKARIDNATTNIGGDLRRVKDQLAQALADQDVHADQAVQDALAGFDGLADRLENLAAETPEDELAQDVEGGADSEPVPGNDEQA